MLFWIFYLISSGLLIALSILAIKIYFISCKRSFTSDRDLDGKVILITGGNAGIGEEYVRDVVRRKAKVIMACRNVKRGEQLARRISAEDKCDGRIIVERCDLSSLRCVKSFCERIRKSEFKIDILVCFAAAVGDKVPPNGPLTDDGFETQFQCNYLSHFLMIHLLIDLVSRSENGRIILTGSSAHLFGKIDVPNISSLALYHRHLFMTYADSKLALMLLTKELASRLANSSITVNSFHPGTIATGGIKNNHIWYIKYGLMALAFLHSKSARDGAQTMIFLTISDDVAGVSGEYFVDCREAPYNRSADDRKLRHDLWNHSIDLVKPFLPHISSDLI